MLGAPLSPKVTGNSTYLASERDWGCHRPVVRTRHSARAGRFLRQTPTGPSRPLWRPAYVTGQSYDVIGGSLQADMDSVSAVCLMSRHGAMLQNRGYIPLLLFCLFSTFRYAGQLSNPDVEK